MLRQENGKGIKADTLNKNGARKMVPSSTTLPHFGRLRGTARCGKFTRTEEEFDVKSGRLEPIGNPREQYYLKLSLYFYLLNFGGT